jgi:hypothetical protein
VQGTCVKHTGCWYDTVHGVADSDQPRLISLHLSPVWVRKKVDLYLPRMLHGRVHVKAYQHLELACLRDALLAGVVAHHPEVWQQRLGEHPPRILGRRHHNSTRQKSPYKTYGDDWWVLVSGPGVSRLPSLYGSSLTPELPL